MDISTTTAAAPASPADPADRAEHADGDAPLVLTALPVGGTGADLAAVVTEIERLEHLAEALDARLDARADGAADADTSP